MLLRFIHRSKFLIFFVVVSLWKTSFYIYCNEFPQFLPVRQCLCLFTLKGNFVRNRIPSWCSLKEKSKTNVKYISPFFSYLHGIDEKVIVIPLLVPLQVRCFYFPLWLFSNLFLVFVFLHLGYDMPMCSMVFCFVF